MGERPDETALWQQWQQAARSPVVDAALCSLWQRIDGAIAERKPVCERSGRCCRFDSYGHRLYVTGLEIAWVLDRIDPPEPKPTSALPLFAGRDACVFQVDGLCSIHAVRPMGCRVFFCDPSATDWQQSLYETMLDELRRLHTAHSLPYRYMEWRQGVDEARAAFKPGPAALTDDR